MGIGTGSGEADLPPDKWSEADKEDAAERDRAYREGRWNPNREGGDVSWEGSVPGAIGDVLSGAWKSLSGRNDYRPGIVQMDTALSDKFRGVQNRGRNAAWDTQQLLAARARGQGPSAAQIQGDRSREQAIAAASSRAASARGGNVGLAQRMAAQSQASTLQQASRDAAQMRAQEQLAAQGQLIQSGQAYSQQANTQRQQEIDIANANLNARLENQRMQTQISTGNAERGQSGITGVAGMAAGALGALSDIRAKEDIEAIDPSVQMAQEKEAKRRELAQAMMQQQSQGTGPNFGGGFAIGSALGGALSDENSKEEIRALRDALVRERSGIATDADRGGMTPTESRDKLGELDAYSYRYKEPVARRLADDMASRYKGYGEVTTEADRDLIEREMRKRRVGVMAQDLEQAEPNAVVETPMGKAIERDKALGFALAAEAGLDKRLKRLEAQKMQRMQKGVTTDADLKMQRMQKGVTTDADLKRVLEERSW